MLEFSILNDLRLDRNTDLGHLKERSTLTEVTDAHFIFAIYKGVISCCNNTEFIP